MEILRGPGRADGVAEPPGPRPPADEGRGAAALRLAHRVVVGLLILAGVVSFGRYVVLMATTSLWTDEFFTIHHYSGRGPLAVVTEYREPNNHIFFNLVNAVTPGRTSVEPIRARIWSFAAVSALLGWILVYFWRRDALAWGSIPFALLTAGPDFLDLTLQARGYGLLSLAALASSILTVEIVRDRKARAIGLLAAVSVVGAWTVPTFGFFAALLWAFLFVATRDRRVLLAALAAGLGIVLAYLPVASQLSYQVSHFDSRWGREYGTVDAVRTTIVTYLLSPAVLGFTVGWAGLVVLVACLAAAAGTLWRRHPAEAAGVSVLLAAVAGFFCVCLALRTPLVRSTAFIVVPLAFAGALAGSKLRFPGPSAIRRTAAVLLTSLLLAGTVSAFRSLRFVPLENWREVAVLLRDTFPRGMPFYVSDLVELLDGYLPEGSHASPAFDRASFEAGDQLYLDTPLENPAGGRVTGSQLAPCAIEFRLPQRRAGYEAIWFCPPTDSHVAAARTPESGNVRRILVDRDVTTGIEEPEGPREGRAWLEVDLVPGRAYRSLVLVAKDPGPSELDVTAVAAGSGAALPSVPVRRSGRVAIVGLGDREVSRVLITPRPGAGPPYRVVEVWANPAGR